jgi:hypothetical protein
MALPKSASGAILQKRSGAELSNRHAIMAIAGIMGTRAIAAITAAATTDRIAVTTAAMTGITGPTVHIVVTTADTPDIPITVAIIGRIDAIGEMLGFRHRGLEPFPFRLNRNGALSLCLVADRNRGAYAQRRDG